MKRREFITLLGGAVAWPVATNAQQPESMRRIGVLTGGADDPDMQANIAAFLQVLQQFGWSDGHNVRIEYRWGAGNADNIRKYAAELAALKPDVILTSGTAALTPLLQTTRTVPIVFVNIADPVGAGFVDSLSRPGGNATGFTPIEGSLGGKWVELLKEIAPQIARVTLMFNPPTATFVEGYLNPFKAAAASLGVGAIVAPVHDMPEVEFLVSASEPNSGVVVIPDAFTISHRAEIILLAARYRIPAVYWSRSFAELGGLISYGPDLVDEYRRAASYADRILKGAKPSELPVQAPVKFELVINLQTAKALGLDVPLHLQQLADEVIE